MAPKRPLESQREAEAALKASDIPEEILDCFWKLASEDGSERIHGATSLKQLCEKIEKEYASLESTPHAVAESLEDLHSCSPVTRYCIKRLVKGLPSARQNARQGFALSLSSIVEVASAKEPGLPGILLRFMRKTFSRKDGQEVIGHVFGVGSIVKSAVNLSDEDVKLIVNELVRLCSMKAFVREASVEIMLQLLHKVKDDEELVGAYVSCNDLQEMIQEPEKAGLPAEILMLSLQLWPFIPDELARKCPILPAKCNQPSKDIFDGRNREKFSSGDLKVSQLFFRKEHLRSLHKYFKDTTSCHPRLHGSWETILHFLMPGYSLSDSIRCEVDEESLSTFWAIMVEDSLFGSSSHEKKYQGLLIFSRILSCIQKTPIESLLTPKFLKCLGNNVNKETYLHNASIQMVGMLVDHVKRMTPAEQQKSKSRILKLSANQLARFFKSNDSRNEAETLTYMDEVIRTLETKDLDGATLSTHLSRIPGMVRKSQDKPSSCKALLMTLMDIYSKSTENTSSEILVEKTKIMGVIMNSFGVLGKSIFGLSELVSVEGEVLDQIVKQGSNHTEDDNFAMFTNIRSKIAKKMKAKSTLDEKKMHSFLHLVSMLELYAFAHPETMDTSLATDLDQIFQEFSDTKMKYRKTGELRWEDALVDCLLSILSRNESPYPSAPLRDAGEIIFRAFAEDITSEGLNSIKDVILQDVDGDGQGSEDSDEEMDDADEALLDYASDESQQEGEEASEDDTNGMQIDKEEENELGVPDATDEQMFKMDAMLGAYFANQTSKKPKKQIREENINFKLRVLSCTEMYMKKCPDSIYLIYLPECLLNALNAVSRPGGPKVLEERLSGLLRKLSRCKCQNLQNGTENLFIEDLESQLRRSLYLASRSQVKLISECASIAYTFLLKAIYHNVKDENYLQIATESLNAAVSDYFTKKKSKLTKSFLSNLAHKVPELASRILPSLIQYTSAARNDYLKIESLAMFGNVIQTLSIEDSTAILKANRSAYAQMVDSASKLLSTGKKKEVKKVLNKVLQVLQNEGTSLEAQMIQEILTF